MRDRIDFLNPKESYIIWYGGVLLLMLVMYQMELRGAMMIMNGLFESLNRNYGLGLRLFSLLELPWVPSLLMGIFAFLIIPLLLMNEKKSSNWWVLVELLVFAVVVNLLVGRAPSFVALLICIVALLLYRMICIHGKAALSDHSTWVMVAGVLVLVAFALIMTAFFKSTVREKHTSFLAFEQRLESMVGLDGFTNYSNGYLNNMSPRHSHDVMLSAVVDRPFDGKLFFRGFVGKDYKGNYWGPTNPDDFYEAMKKEKGTKLTICEKVLGSTYTALSEGSSMGLRKLKLYYTGVPDRFSYAPYFTQYSAGNNYLKERGDANFIRRRESSSEFSFVSPYSMYGNGWVEQKDKRYWKYVNETYLDVPEQLEETLDNFLGGEIPEELSEKISLVQHQLQAQCSYDLKLESLTFSEDFVEHFLNVEKKGFCTHFATAATLLFRRMDVPARYVAGYAAYDEEFELTREGKFEANIKDDAAHAWVEIYVEHLGWIPIETTPGYADNSLIMEAIQRAEYEKKENESVANYDESDSEENANDKEEDSDKTSNEEKNNYASTQQAAGTTNAVAMEQQKKMDEDAGLRYSILWGLVLVGCILLWALIVIIINAVQTKKRHQKDCTKAVIAVRKQLLRRLKKQLINADEQVQKKSEKEIFLCAIELCVNEKNSTQYVEYQVEQILALSQQCYQILQKLEYSKESLGKDDVVVMNQLFDSLFKGKV